MILAGLITCGILVLIALVCLCCENDNKLPPPQMDERDWQGVFMKDVKRYGR